MSTTGAQPENTFLQVIHAWAALAWADGVIADAESEAMSRLIAGSDLSATDQATAKSWLESKVELDTSGIADLSPRAREGIYRAAVRLAHVDQHLAEEEVVFLARLRDGLGIDPVLAELIETSSSDAEA